MELDVESSLARNRCSSFKLARAQCSWMLKVRLNFKQLRGRHRIDFGDIEVGELSVKVHNEKRIMEPIGVSIMAQIVGAR